MFLLMHYPGNTKLFKQKLIPFVGIVTTENYSKKTGFRPNKSRHCAYMIYSVKTRFFKREMLFVYTVVLIQPSLIMCSNSGTTVNVQLGKPQKKFFS